MAAVIHQSSDIQNQTDPKALLNHADALRKLGRLAEAQNAYRRSISLRPSAAAVIGLGQVLLESGSAQEAIFVLRDAVTFAPRDASAYTLLSTALRLAGRFAQAVEVARQALQLALGDADALYALANALGLVGDVQGAVSLYEQLIQLRPHHPDVLINYAALLMDSGDLKASIDIGCQAVRAAPQSFGARYNLGLALLMSGRLAEGWRFYESRWECQGFLGMLVMLPQPLWDGSEARGKTILVRAEQGCGDTIMFCRYAQLLASRGARVILECQQELKAALAGLAGVSQLVTTSEECGEFDCHVPLLSLPYHFQTTLQTIPTQVPYLSVDPARKEHWRRRLAGFAGLNCGLVWAGRSFHKNDRNRSIASDALSPLSGIEGVQFFSLQKDAVSQPPIEGIVDLAGELNDYADTAAALAHLDLLISVDTSAAHLAGALNRPVWTLLPHVPDWRWMLQTDRSPWYPSMRLFRQPEAGDWQTTLHRVAQTLRVYSQQR